MGQRASTGLTTFNAFWSYIVRLLFFWWCRFWVLIIREPAPGVSCLKQIADSDRCHWLVLM
jgi:hypothetical protein